ncbi:polysaccharide biosynthesis protein [Caldalkalibacillus thermarum TA2.A1]|uniref:Polysaccharide biosynthesis protein n=1 Tax=Caldalkalibacillus thermarum (strain TA2.A1) TaxID=986075 RepID=F5L9Z7_CALTT|nr:polysaccharide biosynthesis protein [Caldalkalibacillus thermarum]EGL81867.1 polysaccharide biosynthesis protein [Caldalkalibacillus thermarum TA2.A1]QZT34354.1 polysaccharide biosynthesis protein [Caldalkalibacillus thermarum TA2.A1]
MNGSNPTQQLVKGTAILATAAFLSKLLGVVYKIPYQNITGNYGFYVYEQVYPIYMILLTLSTAGVPIAISKLVAERLAVGDIPGARKVFKVSAVTLMLTGLFSFTLLYTAGAPVLAFLMGDPDLVLPIRSVSFALLVVPVMASIRGYFQGHQNMMPTAVSQVVEQVVRVTTILVLSSWFIYHHYDEYYAGAGAVFGAFTGALAALIVMLLYWRSNTLAQRRHEQTARGEGGDKNVQATPLTTSKGQGAGWAHQAETSYVNLSFKQILRRVAAYALPISLGALVLPLFQLVDNFTIPNMLSWTGWASKEAFNLRGVYARGWPLVQFAAFFATALALALVPSISEAKAKRQHQQISKRTEFALKLTFMIGLASAIGLAILAKPINIMFYVTPEGTVTMAILAFVVIFSTLGITSGAILQGMGYVTLPARHLLIGVGVKFIFNLILLPFLDIKGAALASVVGYMVAALLNLWAIYHIIPVRLFKKHILLPPVYAVCVMGICVSLTMVGLEYGLDSVKLHERLLYALVTLSAVLVGVVVYGLSLLRFEAISRTELSLIPKVNRLIPVLETLKILKKEDPEQTEKGASS